MKKKKKTTSEPNNLDGSKCVGNICVCLHLTVSVSGSRAVYVFVCVVLTDAFNYRNIVAKVSVKFNSLMVCKLNTYVFLLNHRIHLWISLIPSDLWGKFEAEIFAYNSRATYSRNAGENDVFPLIFKNNSKGISIGFCVCYCGISVKSESYNNSEN